MPLASFRFHLTMNTLAFSYVIPAIRAYSGLAPVRQCSCRAYPKTPGVNDFRGYHIHGHLCDGDCAILVAEGEPLESNHFGILVNRLDVSGDRNLLVRLNEILLLKSLLFEELLDTSVGDVLDHLLRE